MYKIHYCITTTVKVNTKLLSEIFTGVLQDAIRENPELKNFKKGGLAEVRVGPIDLRNYRPGDQTDRAFMNLLKVKGILASADDKVMRCDGESQDSNGTDFKWAVHLLFATQ